MSFKGVVLASDSVIQITEIGKLFNTMRDSSASLIGTQSNRAGEWYFPDGGRVLALGGASYIIIFTETEETVEKSI